MFNAGVIYINMSGVNDIKQMYMKLLQVFVKDLSIYEKIDYSKHHEEEIEKLKENFHYSAFVHFLIDLFKQKKYTLKKLKHLDDTGKHDMKFLLCLCNVTEI
jgi:hypothetical protein